MSAQPSVLRRSVSRFGSWLLTLAALLGLTCIVLVIVGLTTNMSLVMFSTGSMAPTIPAGSVALVKAVSGDQIEVGDVVTVARPGQLPVTHRVIDVLSVDGSTATFVMQGDANEEPDPEPYVASEVRVVLGSVPGLARVVVAFQNPIVLGGLTVGATILVVWAFWPRPENEQDAEPSASS